MTKKNNDPDLNDQAKGLQKSIDKYFADVEDYRRIRSIHHTLIHILFITICAVTSGCNDLKAVAEYAKTKKNWLTEVLGLEDGVPSYTTFWTVFRFLNPETLGKCFINWVESMIKSGKGNVVAIDGKAQRGTAKSDDPNSFVHIVSAWASELGLTLGQCKVEGKSNEITAIPKLLEMIDIEETIVTIDAMGTQKDIAKKIIERRGDYILALKGNHSILHDEVINYFEQALEYGSEGIEYQNFEEFNDGHGRIESRCVFTTENIDFIECRNDWKKFKSIVCVQSKRTIEDKTSSENRYYISSLAANPKELGLSIRSHWGIENSVHWILDVAFREDSQKAQAGHIAENLSVIRRIALNFLKQDKTVKAGIEIKRQKAGWDNNYLLAVLGVKSFS